ncbi:MAG: hypothetical protein IJA39_04455, partial [Clostridia bacterium]|nr:hypothetical protein [Clostridia bacterium]
VDGEEVNSEIIHENGGYKYYFGLEKTDIYNYFGIKYSSDAYMKGVITYGGWENGLTEEFFLEPGADAEFYSLIDGYLDRTKMNKLTSLEFYPLDKTEADFTLHGVGLFNREIYDNEIYIENDEYKLGITLNWGGALSYLEDKNSSVEAVIKDGVTKVDSDASSRYGVRAKSKNVNLINKADTGRLVQQSYYGTFECDSYTGGVFMDQKWNYNPVQGGNQFNDAAKIVDVRITDESIYIKCRPLDWAKEKEFITPSYMEATYSLSDGLVKAVCRFVDYSGYPEYVTTQECPAFYCIEPLNRFVYYGGDKSWTGDTALSYENELIFWPDAGYPNFYSTENWAAFVGEFDDSFGIGLYVPNDAPFLSGVLSRGGCTTARPAEEGPTSYIAAVEKYEFRSFNPTSYEFYLSTGDVNEIRNNFSKVAG